MPLDLDDLPDGVDREAVEAIHAIASRLGTTIYETVRLAANHPHSTRKQERHEVGKMWRDLADDVIEFAMKED